MVYITVKKTSSGIVAKPTPSLSDRRAQLRRNKSAVERRKAASANAPPIQILQPERDDLGMTEIDRQISTNKAKQNISEVSVNYRDITQTYTGKVTGSKFIGVRTVFEQEQTERQQARDFAAAQQQDRTNLRQQGMTESEYRKVTNTQTPKEKLDDKIKQIPIRQIFTQAAASPMDSDVSISLTPKPIKTGSDSFSISKGFDLRISKLLEREERLQETKDLIFETLKINRLPTDSSISFLGVLKSTARVPFEIGSLPVFIGGRLSFIGEAAFNKEGRKELFSALKKTPSATIQAVNPTTSEGLVNLGLAVLAVKSVASNPPAFISKASNRYVPYEEAGFKVNPDVTEPYSMSEILKTQGKDVTGVHTSFSNIFKKSFSEFIKDPFGKKTETQVIGFPDQAKGFRKAIDQYSFYKSLPEKATGEPQAYGGYIGIAEDVVSTTGSKVKFSLGEPKRYAFIFEDEVIQRVSPIEKTGVKIGGVKGGKTIMDYQKSQTGSSFIAAENLLGKSIEGQYVSPEGSILKLTEANTYTIYRQPSTFKNPILNKAQEFTGIGLKNYRIDIAKVRTMPSELQINANVKATATTEMPTSEMTISKSIKSPAISIYPATTSPQSMSFNKATPSVSIKSSSSIRKVSASIPSITSSVSSISKSIVSPSVPSRSSTSRVSNSRSISTISSIISPSVSSYPLSRSTSSRSRSSKSKSIISRVSPSKPSSSRSIVSLYENPLIEDPPTTSDSGMKFKSKSQRKSQDDKYLLFKSKYVPSLEAEIFKIKGKRSRFAEISGLGLRAITKTGGI